LEGGKSRLKEFVEFPARSLKRILGKKRSRGVLSEIQSQRSGKIDGGSLEQKENGVVLPKNLVEKRNAWGGRKGDSKKEIFSMSGRGERKRFLWVSEKEKRIT